jgi:tetratricopeptide (TPR) repeat protein
MTSIAQILNTALQHHRAGRLGEAAAGYLGILKENPRHGDALHLLGVVAQQQGKLDMSIELMQEAVRGNPSIAHYHHNLGNTYLQKECPKEAAECYRQAISLKPDYHEAHHALGTALTKLEKLDAAVQAYRKAIQITPSVSEAYYNLGRVLAIQEQDEEAVQQYRIAIQIDDGHVEYFFNLGGLLFKQEKYCDAIDCYQRALQLQPDDAEIHNNLGRSFAANENLPAAIASYQRSITLNPTYVEANSNLGLALLQQGNLSQAEHFCRRAVRLDADSPEAQYSLGNVFRETYRLEESIECYRKFLQLNRAKLQCNTEKSEAHGNSTYWQVVNNLALSLNESGQVDAALDCYREALRRSPENALLHTNLAFTLLMNSNFAEGWVEHEWRFKTSHFEKRRDFPCPQWKGEPLQGEKILLHAEQGFGDTLQFVRYAPLVAERGATVILEVQPGLRQLLSNIPGVKQIISRGETLPEVSWHCPLMSLPLAFSTRLETIPSSPSYINVSQNEREEARRLWPGVGLRVGLAWSGNPKHSQDSSRSIHLSQMTALGEISGVSFYSVQVGEATKQIAELQGVFKIIDACSRIRDFADTAAFIAGLDLVITVDTSIAHLTGALGIPVWILLAQNRIDWRWLRDREDSPWYPSARLFRQSKPGDWAELIQRVKVELEKFIERK